MPCGTHTIHWYESCGTHIVHWYGACGTHTIYRCVCITTVMCQVIQLHRTPPTHTMDRASCGSQWYSPRLKIKCIAAKSVWQSSLWKWCIQGVCNRDMYFSIRCSHTCQPTCSTVFQEFCKGVWNACAVRPKTYEGWWLKRGPLFIYMCIFKYMYLYIHIYIYISTYITWLKRVDDCREFMWPLAYMITPAHACVCTRACVCVCERARESVCL